MIISKDDRVRAAQAIVAAILAGGILVLWGVYDLNTYGASLFCGVPVLMGFLVGWIDNFYSQNFWRAVKVMLYSLACVAVVFLAMAFEGVICLLMAFPIAALAGLFGTCLGVLTARSSSLVKRTFIKCSPLVTLPLLMMFEADHLPEPPLLHVQSEIVVNAPIGTVWNRVISFPEIAPPRELLFQTGIAYPINAVITGTGVGAVRHCNFSTGTFVEPITTWDKPNLLQFSVLKEPEPMKEMSPYKIEPPHLKGYLKCVRGEFRLEPLSKGRTELIGTTWYRDNLWPQAYWSIWSNSIIHQIHLRVLRQIKTVAESDAAR